MFNLKLTIYGAIFGLIISIFFGIVGGIQFGVIMLRAIISSLLCGGILALASFLFKRFLSDSTSDLSNLDNSTPTTGGLVDIRIDEDVLPDSDHAPDFYVSRKYGETQPEEIRKFDSGVSTRVENTTKNDVIPTETHTEKSAETSFVEPVKPASVDSSNLDTSNSKSESQEFIPTSLAKEKYKSSNTDSGESLSDSLDSLPEFGSIVPDARPQESEVIEDSAFARGESSSVELVPDAVVGADTNLMAEAIKTLLRREG